MEYARLWFAKMQAPSARKALARAGPPTQLCSLCGERA